MAPDFEKIRGGAKKRKFFEKKFMFGNDPKMLPRIIYPHLSAEIRPISPRFVPVLKHA